MNGAADNVVCKPGLEEDLTLIKGDFAAYLRDSHHADFTIRFYCGFLCRMAKFLTRSGTSVRDLKRADAARVVQACLPGWKAVSRRTRLAALHSWLKFRGQFKMQPPRTSWLRFVEAYAQFMQSHRGLVPSTRAQRTRMASAYLEWQCRKTGTNLGKIRPDHILRYAEHCARVHATKTVADELSALRLFLRFLCMRGIVSAQLEQAVPRVAGVDQTPRKEVLTETQRTRLLAAFDFESSEGRRDYTMALCMLDLGLRGIEVCRLRLSDIDWSRKLMRVPPAKLSPGRELPLPSHVLKSLRIYVKHRPSSTSDELFVGHDELEGRPLSQCAVASAMERAYRRCGFPKRWHGTHRLRHTFATRLSNRGADLKQIADLLGHHVVSSTNSYAQANQSDLRTVAQPWPRYPK